MPASDAHCDHCRGGGQGGLDSQDSSSRPSASQMPSVPEPELLLDAPQPAAGLFTAVHTQLLFAILFAGLQTGLVVEVGE